MKLQRLYFTFICLFLANVQLANKIHVHARVQWEDILEEKTNVFIKSPHLKPSGKEFKEAKLSNCFSADSLPVESAQCLRLRDLQTELKISTKPLLKSYCALSSGKESAEKHYSTWFLLKSLLARFQMWAFYENIRFSSGMSSHRTLACTWILLAHWTVVYWDKEAPAGEEQIIYLC